MVAFSCLSQLLVAFTYIVLSSTLQQKMEITIKEDNMTITVRLEENTVDEAIDAALVIISRIFSEKAVEEALKRLEW
jgi:hypothetical protein